MASSTPLAITHLVGGRCSGESANGVDRSIVHFAQSQAKLGHEVKLIGVSHRPPYPIEGIESVTAAPGWSCFFPSRETRQEILRGSPDVLHLHGAYVPIYPGIARFARKENLPYVITPHGNFSQLLLKRQPLRKWVYRRFFELPMAEQALFVHAIADQADIRRYGVTAPVVSAINGMDPEPESLAEEGDVLKVLEIPRVAKLFLFLGRLDIPQKGLDVLLRGFARFVAGGDAASDTHLVLAGPEWDGSRDHLLKLASDLGVAGHITLTGGIFGEEKRQLIRACHFFVHPSRWEAGVPFSVLEALSFGKQCLVTEAVDRDHRLQNAGICRGAELTEDSIADGLQAFAVQSAEEIMQRGSEARDYLRENFSWERSARQLVEGYKTHLAVLGP